MFKRKNWIFFFCGVKSLANIAFRSVSWKETAPRPARIPGDVGVLPIWTHVRGPDFEVLHMHMYA